jgi:hypothetical protein
MITFDPFSSWPAPEPAIQGWCRERLDGRVKPGHEEEMP